MSHLILETCPGGIFKAELGKQQLAKDKAGGWSCLPWRKHGGREQPLPNCLAGSASSQMYPLTPFYITEIITESFIISGPWGLHRVCATVIGESHLPQPAVGSLTQLCYKMNLYSSSQATQVYYVPECNSRETQLGSTTLMLQLNLI